MPAAYRIRIRNHLDTFRTHWFDGMTLSPLESGETELTGWFEDQGCLHHILEKIRDLNLTLLSVDLVEETVDHLEKNGKSGSYCSAAVYEIRVKSPTSKEWMRRFEDLEILPLAKDEYLFRGTFIDQPALHGLLRRVQVANLILIAIRRIPIYIP